MKPGRKPPPEPYHQYNLRLPVSLWTRLHNHAHRHHRSVRAQVQAFVEAGLLDSPVGVGAKPSAALPWLDGEEGA